MKANTRTDIPLTYQKENNLNFFKPNISSATDSTLNVILEYEREDHRAFAYEPVKKVTVFDVAAYVLKRLGELTTMKLHKIVYYCQAWSLVWDEKPLFDEEIEAWANGPVVRRLFSYHKGQYSISKISLGNPDALNAKQKETIDSVINYYGDKPSQWLIELTHLEDPWKNIRIGMEPTERGNRIITNESMAEYYSSL